MPFSQNDAIRFYRFASFIEANVTHAIFTRQGGVSPKPWDSLNVGSTVGDHPSRVSENYKRALRAIDRQPESIFDVWQVHGVNAVCTEVPRQKDTPHQKADIILTDKTDVTLFMRFADCVPILLYDPNQRVIGIVHAGWKGTVKRAVSVVVNIMKNRYSSNPVDILAGIGPSICKNHYEVGSDVIQYVKYIFGNDTPKILSKINGKTNNPKAKFDLWTANRLLLEQAGVTKIEVANLCTFCHLEDWYSHRGEQGKTGRFGVLISL